MPAASSELNTRNSRAEPLSSQIIAERPDWVVAEYVCTQGPGDRITEECHQAFSIAAVVQGSFRYRSDQGTSLLTPGAFLLGNHGACFECGHEHSRGDQCIAIHLAPHYFSEIAASSTGSSRFRFDRCMLPQHRHLSGIMARLESGRAWSTPLATEESVVTMTETILASLSGHRPSLPALKTHEARRMSEVAEYISLHAREDLSLDTLAGVALMSKYHFLRSFRKTFQITPHRYVLGIRMRRTAKRLLMTTESVSHIALDEGFGDLSTFNAHFRTYFGTSPRTFRQMKPGKPSR